MPARSGSRLTRRRRRAGGEGGDDEADDDPGKAGRSAAEEIVARAKERAAEIVRAAEIIEKVRRGRAALTQAKSATDH